MSVVCLTLLLGGVAADAGAYEIDFHYYVVYVLLRSRGYDATTSDQLASFSQYVDDNADTEPLYRFSSTRAKFHFAGSTTDVATSENAAVADRQLRQAFATFAAGGSDGKYIVGAALHLFADTFSHASFTAWRNRMLNCREYSWRPCWGHADAPEKGHQPDYPSRAVPKALRAAEAIYNVIPAAPGGALVPWSALQSDLSSILAADDASHRSDLLRDLASKRFGDYGIYVKSQPQREKHAFEAAVRK